MSSPTVSARRGRPPRHNRDAIVAATAEVLVSRGYAATRYADVSEASGVPIASVQHYFPRLRDLLMQAVQHGVRSELEEVRERAEEAGDPLAAMLAVIDVAIAADDPLRRGGWVMWVEYWRAAAHDPVLAEDSREVARQWNEMLAGIIADGVATGAFRGDVDPAAAAAEIHALIDGCGITLAADDDPAAARRATTMVETAMRRLLV